MENLINTSIVDLDSIIVNGSAAYEHAYKHGQRSINFGGLLYLFELISESVSAKYGLVIIAGDYAKENSADYILSCRDRLTRLQYEICLDKLGEAGVPLVVCNSREEIDSEIYRYASSARQCSNAISIYTENYNNVLDLIDAQNVLIYTKDSLYTSTSLQSVELAVDVPELAVALYKISRGCVSDRNVFQNHLNVYTHFVSDNHAAGVKDGEMTMSCLDYSKVPGLVWSYAKGSGMLEQADDSETLVKNMKLYNESYGFKYDLSPEYLLSKNDDGLYQLLKLFGMYMLIGYLNYDTETRIKGYLVDYIKSKVSEYYSDELAARANISTTTDFLTAEEAITITFDGSTIQKKVNTDDSSEEIITDFFS